MLQEINGFGGGRAAPVRVHRAGRRRLDALRVLDLLRLLRRRGQPDRPPPARRGAGLGGARVGLGVAGQPAHPLQPGVGRSRRASRGRSARRTCGGTRRPAGGPATTSPTSRPTRPRLPPAGRGAGGGRHRRRRPVHHAGRRPGLAVRPHRPGRRAPADPLRAPRVAVRQPAVRPAVEPGPPGDPPPGQPLQPHAGQPRGRRLPLRRDHLPAHRAPHRRRDVPVPGLPVRAAAGDVLRGEPGAGRRAGPGERRVGHDVTPAPPSRPGCWSPTGCRR